MLQFDIEGITNEILIKLSKELSYAFISWENEVKSKTTHGLFGGGINPKIESYLKIESKQIIGYLRANTYVLAESYGTGSFMLDDNPGFDDFKKKHWHAYRTKGKAITGREKGTYKDLFGRKHQTSGVFRGKNIEGKRVFKNSVSGGKDYFISPTKPSYAIQLANQWLKVTYLPKAYSNAINSINFSKFLIER